MEEKIYLRVYKEKDSEWEEISEAEWVDGVLSCYKKHEWGIDTLYQTLFAYYKILIRADWEKNYDTGQ